MNKVFKKIGYIAIMLIIVLATTFAVQNILKPVKASAEEIQTSTNLQVDTSTFLDMRQSVKDPIKNDQTANFKQFINWKFQHDENNFNQISASQVENLIDKRHGLTLEQESKAIQVNKDSNGNIVGPKISDTSSLTVFTYGQNASLSHWSNSG